MARPQFTYRELAPGVLQLGGAMGLHATLVLGRESALLYDTMSGAGDLRGYIATLTDLPLTVVCGHSHFDHAGGCGQFEEVWVSPMELPLLLPLRDPALRRSLMEEIWDNQPLPFDPEVREQMAGVTFDRFLPLEEGQRFRLGGKTARAVALPGHTPGSVGLLLEEDRLLLSGDAMTPVMCLFFPESLSLAVYLETLEKALALPIDRFVTGHMDHALPREALLEFRAAAEAVTELRGMRFQYDILPRLGGWLYLYREGVGEEMLAVILRDRRPGDLPPRRSTSKNAASPPT